METKKKHIPRQADEKKALVTRLHRIIGQLEGIERMIEEDRYCEDILNQTAAVQKALQSVGYLLLDTHLKTCVREKIQAGDEEIFDEVSSLIRKLK